MIRALLALGLAPTAQASPAPASPVPAASAPAAAAPSAVRTAVRTAVVGQPPRSYVIPATGVVRDAGRANLGTLVGAICFLIGALLLLPERTEEIDPDAAPGGERPARP